MARAGCRFKYSSCSGCEAECPPVKSECCCCAPKKTSVRWIESSKGACCGITQVKPVACTPCCEEEEEEEEEE